MFDHSFPNFECSYPSSWKVKNVAEMNGETLLHLNEKTCSGKRTCVGVFFLHRITVSRPTRSITSSIRSCFSKSRGASSVFFEEEEDFFFHVLEDSVNMTSLIVSPTFKKSFDFAIWNDRRQIQNNGQQPRSNHVQKLFDGRVLRHSEGSKIFIASVFSIEFHLERFVLRSNRLSAGLNDEQRMPYMKRYNSHLLQQLCQVDQLLVVRSWCETDGVYSMWTSLVPYVESRWFQWFSNRRIRLLTPRVRWQCLADEHVDSRVEDILVAWRAETWDDCFQRRTHGSEQTLIRWRTARRKANVCTISQM